MESPAERLIALGLNRLEAGVYLFLLANPPMTAYRVAKHVGAATANTYKAIESLSRRGAVLVEEGDSRLCRAVPAREFLERLEREFAERTRKTAKALEKLERRSYDERVYKLESVAQMLERARQMLETRAESVAVVDAFPAVLDKLVPSIEAAASRGVRVLVQAYRPVAIRGASVVVPELGPRALEFWNSEQLNLVIDGRECILALLDRQLTRIFQGLWSNSLYLSCILLAGIRSEQTIHQLRKCLGHRDDAKRMKAVLAGHRFFLDKDVPGQTELMARFVESKETPDDLVLRAGE
ncbi:MAG: helix-turn-helix domain-containing protein [Bryobacteraceae bacterium]